MTETLQRLNSTLNGYVWSWPMIVLLMGTGLLLTLLTGAVQFRRLGFALCEVLGKPSRKPVVQAHGDHFELLRLPP